MTLTATSAGFSVSKTASSRSNSTNLDFGAETINRFEVLSGQIRIPGVAEEALLGGGELPPPPPVSGEGGGGPPPGGGPPIITGELLRLGPELEERLPPPPVPPI